MACVKTFNFSDFEIFIFNDIISFDLVKPFINAHDLNSIFNIEQVYIKNHLKILISDNKFIYIFPAFILSAPSRAI